MKNNIKEFFGYLMVGGIATLAEWMLFYVLETLLLLHYFVATILAYIISTFVNWGVGRILVFKTSQQSLFKELVKIYLTSIIGLGLNLVIMFLNIEWIGISEMISKIFATGIVFLFNFFVRKLLIYK